MNETMGLSNEIIVFKVYLAHLHTKKYLGNDGKYFKNGDLSLKLREKRYTHVCSGYVWSMPVSWRLEENET